MQLVYVYYVLGDTMKLYISGYKCTDVLMPTLGANGSFLHMLLLHRKSNDIISNIRELVPRP
jgi:hypothetical protein